ncbi:hypothetical protein [Rhabdothermincola sediminis]|uniref:hypothetical protein n=1 Tax=Rhabdothermincola sediminis TaxID=2751370 RepID=UPI001AA09AD0|nr:hypothetical protein [Rhabdothermincola sediminis]
MGSHPPPARRASLRWLRNRDLRQRRRRVQVTVDGGRLLAFARGLRWWHHFLRPSEAVLHVGRRDLAVWVSLDDHHPPHRDRLRRWHVVLVLEPPGARTRRPSGDPVIDLREVLDLRPEGCEPASDSLDPARPDTGASEPGDRAGDTAKSTERP